MKKKKKKKDLVIVYDKSSPIKGEEHPDAKQDAKMIRRMVKKSALK
jgi:hypothetical protein